MPLSGTAASPSCPVVSVCNAHFNTHSITVNKDLYLPVLVSRSSVSLLLGFSAMLSVSLVSRVTDRSLHDNMLGCQSPSGEWS